MLSSHMLVAWSTCDKSSQANPADMRSTASTSHMITAVNLLDGRLAFWTVLNTQLLLRFLKRLISPGSVVFVLLTRHTFVLSMAMCACYRETLCARG